MNEKIAILLSDTDIWKTIEAESIINEIRKVADLTCTGLDVTMALAPASNLKNSIGFLQNLAQKTVDKKAQCLAIDFKSTSTLLGAVYRTYPIFYENGSFAITAPFESRSFSGQFLAVILPVLEEDRLNLARIETLFSSASVVFSGNIVGQTSQTITITKHGEVRPYAKGSHILGPVEFWADPSVLARIEGRLPEEAILFLRAASSHEDINSKFIFTYMAYEFAVGASEQRKFQETSMMSDIIKKRIKEIRHIRGSHMKKTNDAARPPRAADISVLQNIIGLTLLSHPLDFRKTVKLTEATILLDDKEMKHPVMATVKTS